MLGIGGWKTIVGVFCGAFAMVLPQAKELLDPTLYKWLMILSAFCGFVLTGLGYAHKIEKSADKIANANKNQGGFVKLNLLSFLMVGAILISCSGQNLGSIVQPTTNIDPDKGPICDRAEFNDSWICQQLRANGIANAEDARDLLLDANDISLIMEVYTTDELTAFLDKWEQVLKDGAFTYAFILSGIIKDTGKAQRVSNILKRRFGFLVNSNQIIKQSDINILHILIQRIREASGIQS